MLVSPAPWGGDPACGHHVSAAYQWYGPWPEVLRADLAVRDRLTAPDNL